MVLKTLKVCLYWSRWEIPARITLWKGLRMNCEGWSVTVLFIAACIVAAFTATHHQVLTNCHQVPEGLLCNSTWEGNK